MFYEARLLRQIQERLATIRDEDYARSAIVLTAHEATLVVRALKRYVKEARERKEERKS